MSILVAKKVLGHFLKVMQLSLVNSLSFAQVTKGE